jgi:hypothetical protein
MNTLLHGLVDVRSGIILGLPPSAYASVKNFIRMEWRQLWLLGLASNRLLFNVYLYLPKEL